MRKIFINHHIYTFAAGVLVFYFVFSGPPLDTDHIVAQARIEAEQAAKAKKVAKAKPIPVVQSPPAKPKATGTVIAKQPVSPVAALPASGAVSNQLVTASDTGLRVPVTQSAGGTYLRVDADNLRMRSGPSSSADTLASYPRGTRLEQVRVYGKWMQVRTIDGGTTGWMFADYLAPAQ